jgi:hypothetical protein
LPTLPSTIICQRRNYPPLFPSPLPPSTIICQRRNNPPLFPSPLPPSTIICQRRPTIYHRRLCHQPLFANAEIIHHYFHRHCRHQPLFANAAPLSTIANSAIIHYLPTPPHYLPLPTLPSTIIYQRRNNQPLFPSPLPPSINAN